MRERSLLYLFLALNGLLAGAFAIYLFLSTHRQPKILAGSLPVTTNKVAKTTNSAPKPAVVATAPAPAPTNSSPAPVVAAAPTPSAKTFGWQDVESPDYLKYVANLRLVGCPDDKIQQIIIADINQLIDQKRLKEAVTHDMPWWKVEPNQYSLVNVMQEKGRALEEERRALIEKLLGSDVAENEKSESLLWNVQLTGPVLGALAAKTHNTVQEICQRSVERHQAYQWSRFNEGQPINQVEMAKLREQTRSDLRQVLSPQEVEEFTLRYSHNAHQLRMELAGMDPTPDEFRKIFRAIDAADHQMQLEYGSVEAMSPKQRERHERQRDAAIKDSMPQQRYQAYLMTKDQLYRQAQMTAMQYGAPSKAVMPIYQMNKANEARRQQILTNATLSAQQKNEELNRVNMDQLRALQQIVNEANAAR
ncbi:MAG TPA: hypothetical protein VFB63_01455 [Bryobacteraceae bacterium]|nr:hypothetical protein [Bryobacteraceae bacterium]